jgi:hypothetical protein
VRRLGTLIAASLAALALCAGVALAQQSERAPSLGTAAAGLVEDIQDAPNAGVALFDYVYPGQRIELGQSGTLVLSFFDSCVVETIRGGSVEVGPADSRVTGGQRQAEQVACDTSKPVVSELTGEAGATITRVSPFIAANWAERVVATFQPIFKWEGVPPGTPVVFRILYMDANPPQLVWQAQVAQPAVQYPADAPQLIVGGPFRAEATLPNGQVVSALFSIDPELEVSPHVLNRVVALGPPR